MGKTHEDADARRKDGYSEQEAIRFLGDMVETIARGVEVVRTEIGRSTKVRIEKGDSRVFLVKRPGSNAWVITAYEYKPGSTGAGNDAPVDTHSQSTLTRKGMGAGNSKIARGSGSVKQSASRSQHGYEEKPGERSGGRAPAAPTHSAASRTRDKMGAGHSKVAQDQESVNAPLSDVELHAVVERITAVVKFHDADGVQVVPDFDALPAAAKKDAKRQGAGKGDVEGVFHNGTIYLIADMIRDEVHAETVLFHEAAHRGLRALYSDAKVKVAMNRL